MIRVTRPSPLLLALIAVLALLSLAGLAHAQILLPGVPDQWQAVTQLLINIASGAVLYLLTAIAKRQGKTTGVTTVVISAVLSLLVGAGFTAYTAYLNHGAVPWPLAVTTAVWAFVQANLTYFGLTSATQNLRAAVARQGTRDTQQAGPTTLNQADEDDQVPTPGGDGSPQFNGNESRAVQDAAADGGAPSAPAPTASGIQPFAGFNPGAALQGVLANPLVEGMIRNALKGLGLPVDAVTILKVAVKIGPDLLLDGNPMLGEDNLAVVNNAVIDVAIEHGLLARPSGTPPASV